MGTDETGTASDNIVHINYIIKKEGIGMGSLHNPLEDKIKSLSLFALHIFLKYLSQNRPLLKTVQLANAL